MSLVAVIDNTLYWTFAFTYSWYAYYVLFHRNVPNIRTAPAITEKIIEILRQDMEARKSDSYTIIDLGSGTGSLTRALARALPQAKIVGIERIGQTWLWAEMLRRRAKLDNLEYRRKDFFACDLAEADAVIMYLIPSLMKQLGEKLRKETRPGTLLIANKFTLYHDWQPEQSMAVKTLFFHQKDLHIYRQAAAQAVVE